MIYHYILYHPNKDIIIIIRTDATDISFSPFHVPWIVSCPSLVEVSSVECGALWKGGVEGGGAGGWRGKLALTASDWQWLAE